MNRANFTSKSTFPVSTYTYEFLQEMIQQVAQLARIGGDNYILSGCEVVSEPDDGYTPGLMVINGEMMPFSGGQFWPEIEIVEVSTDDHFAGEDYPEAYVERYARPTASGNILFSSLKRLQPNIQMQDETLGIVKMWAGQVAKIPANYHLCDGSELLIADYPGLYANLGVIFGGNGTTTFCLPDLRGKFVAGYNSADSDYDAIGDGGGAKTVTLTDDQIPTHNHLAAGNTIFNKLACRAADGDANNTPGSLDALTPATEYRVGGMTESQWTQATIQSVGGNVAHENRPPYFTLAYIIKVI
jgi:microcystin-dependent protein